MPVEPVERYLAYLTDIERSPNTVKAYAHDLKDWFVFLAGRGLDWREVRLEDVGEFVAWLRLPPAARDGRVAVLPSVEEHCAAATVNRKLSAVSAFYQHAARHGVDLGELLTTWQPAGRRRELEAVPAPHQQGQPAAAAHDRVEGAAQAPAGPDRREIQAILDGLRPAAGPVLVRAAVRHRDADRRGAGAAARGHGRGRAHGDGGGAGQRQRGPRQVGAPRTIPVSAELVRLYADYLHGEYGDLDCDYVFVNLWAEPRGQPLTYPAVYDLVVRLRRRTGIDFDPHWCRHTSATRLLRAGRAGRGGDQLLGHASVTTTVDVYGHLSAEDARKALEQAGWFTGRARCGCDRGAGPAGGPARPALLERLMAVVRPEFRADVLVFDAGRPGVRRGACRCGLRTVSLAGMACARVTGCGGWARAGGTGRVRGDDRSAVASATPERRLPGRRMRLRDRPRRDVSAAHQRWHRGGRADLDTWLSTRRRSGAAPAAPAGAIHCDLWPQAAPAVLPQPRQHLAGQRPPRRRGVRPPVREVAVAGDDIVRLDAAIAASCSWRCSMRCNAATTNGAPRPSRRSSCKSSGRWPRSGVASLLDRYPRSGWRERDR